MDWLVIALTPLGGYLAGSVPFGYLVARARGVDIFHQGSGNIGATNVGRVVGRPFGILVFALDFAKGAIAVLAALAVRSRWPGEGTWWGDGGLEVLTGLGAFLGHLFPLYLGLRGGKGVATGLGVALVLVPGPALAALAAWAVIVTASRYVSLASIAAVLVLAGSQIVATGGSIRPRTVFCLLAGALVLVKHRSNVGRLLAGNENQLRENTAMICLGKSLHVLAVGLWFGVLVCFTFVGASLIDSFTRLGQADPRIDWFPHTATFARSDDAIDGPKEQGVRAFGYAVAPMFPWFFLVQGVCGFVALVTALAWARLGRVHRLRVSLLITAIALLLAAWPIELYVSELRGPRNASTDAYLRAAEPTDALRAEMQASRSAFGTWHGVSLALNFATIACVAAVTALAGHLPATPDKP